MKKFNDTNIRPLTLKDYKGQEKVKKALSVYIQAAKMRQECLDHVIIYASSGLGKTTLANVIANEMGQSIKSVSAPAIKNPEDMATILLELLPGEILFIDEIHRLTMKTEEILYFAMEDFVVDATIDGTQVRAPMKPFTLLGATTSKGMLSEPLRNRFQISVELTPYENNHIANIVKSSFLTLDTEIDDDCSMMIAERSRGVPRIANGFVRRVKDFAMVMGEGKITPEIVNEAFDFLGIDNEGLTEQDRRYLRTLVKEFKLKSVGIDTLASALNDDKKTLENTVEPYLIQKGFIRKGPRGRMATEKSLRLVMRKEHNNEPI